MSDDDEIKDPLEKMDEEDDEDEDLDPAKLKKKGLHIEGEDEIADPAEVLVDPLLHKDPLLDELDTPMGEDEEEVDLVDDEFSDKADW